MHDTRVWRNLIGQACCKLYPDWWGGCICIGLSLSLRPRPVIQYHIEFFHSPCPGQIGGRLCQLPVLTVSVKLFRASTRRVLPTTMSDWTANIFSFFQTNVEIKRELRYCDGFKCKSIYFIPQVCVHVVIFWIWTHWCQGRRQASWSLCPVSGCCLYGLLDSEGQFTGDNIAWVYPDNKTALLGRSVHDGVVNWFYVYRKVC